jgi:hypothetical protein
VWNVALPSFLRQAGFDHRRWRAGSMVLCANGNKRITASFFFHQQQWLTNNSSGPDGNWLLV